MEVVELPVEIRYLLLNPAAKEVERRIRDLQTHLRGGTQPTKQKKKKLLVKKQHNEHAAESTTTCHHQNHEFQERKELGLDDDEAVVPEATGRTLAVGEVS